MSRRIDIELTSSRPDGTWTWRAAGARAPKGVLDGSLLPAGASIGSVFRADAEAELEGVTIVSVTDPKAKAAKTGLLELLPTSTPFEAVTQQLATRDRNDRRDRGDRGDRPRRDRPAGDRPGGDRPGGDRRDRGPRPGGERPRDTEGGDRRGPRPQGRNRPTFAPPPELPQRPKAKRLKPGRAHRNAVLAELPEAQRPVAERALQGGLAAVRQAVNEQNARLKSEGKEEIPAAGLLSIAEQLLPKLRVAEWLDRADAAKADLDELDLRDLRSVVAAAEDPIVSRDETTRELAKELREGLVAKQEKELQLWFADIEAAIEVGRVIRALKLSSQPPKAGVRFPAELAKRLAGATTESLTADAAPDRWSAILEAAAFSPVRAQIVPTARPEQPGDELLATVKRLAPLLAQIAALFGLEVAPGASAPKPLRPTKPTGKPTAPNKPSGAKPSIPPPPTQSVAKAGATESESAPPAEQPEAVDTRSTVEVAEAAPQVEAEAVAEPQAEVAEAAAPEEAAAAPEAEVTEAAAPEEAAAEAAEATETTEAAVDQGEPDEV